MNLVLRKFKNAYGRLKTGFQIALFPEKFYLYDKALHLHHRLYYSQEGEDMLLARFFFGRNNGFYIDVGAHHPQRLSNTYYFYLQGWRGINIDAMPGSMTSFKTIRPKDINLEIAISDTRQKLIYYAFNEPALNGFSKDLADKYSEAGEFKIAFEKEIETHTLAEILDEYLPEKQKIDFMSIDVEGLDYQVLNSNNWEKYRPVLVLVEDLNKTSLDHANQSKITSFMEKQNYQLYCKTVNTLFFKDKDCPDLKLLRGYEG
jgi:FkbM family methyltransferase